MTLKEARETLQNIKTTIPEPDCQKLYDAIGLGIEASSFIILSRVTTPGSVPTLLSKETED